MFRILINYAEDTVYGAFISWSFLEAQSFNLRIVHIPEESGPTVTHHFAEEAEKRGMRTSLLAILNSAVTF